MLNSGLRLTEGVRLYNSLVNDSVIIEEYEGFLVMPLGYFGGTKLACYGFLTERSFRMAKSQRKLLKYKKIMGTISKKFKGVVSWKVEMSRASRISFCAPLGASRQPLYLKNKIAY